MNETPTTPARCVHDRDPSVSSQGVPACNQCRIEQLSIPALLAEVNEYAGNLRKQRFIPRGWWVVLAERLRTTSAELEEWKAGPAEWTAKMRVEVDARLPVPATPGCTCIPGSLGSWFGPCSDGQRHQVSCPVAKEAINQTGRAALEQITHPAPWLIAKATLLRCTGCGRGPSPEEINEMFSVVDAKLGVDPDGKLAWRCGTCGDADKATCTRCGMTRAEVREAFDAYCDGSKPHPRGDEQSSQHHFPATSRSR